MSTRELKDIYTLLAARNLCKALGHADELRMNDDWACPTCRAAVVRLVDGGGEATSRTVNAIIERAEQACRYALKHQEFSADNPEFKSGWDVAAHVCEKAIRPHVLCHLSEDALASAEPWPEVSPTTEPWLKFALKMAEDDCEGREDATDEFSLKLLARRKAYREVLALITHAQQARTTAATRQEET